MRLTGANLLVVPPFECAWLMGEEARFAEPGKGCVAFEAMTENDVTVVFKELAGSKHYRTDSGPSYTLILGSHCNRRLKIEVDGQPVVDVAHVMLEPTHFEHYWINVSDGVLTVGKGDPGEGVICQWVDSKPNCTIQYVGLSSWDKHVVYRNIQVLPPLQLLRTQVPLDNGGFAQYLENEELADLHFIVSRDKRTVPAHKILLVLCCSKLFDIFTLPTGVVHLPHVNYQSLRALLQYIYTGHALVYVNELYDVKQLAEEFGLEVLVSQCEELMNVIGGGSDDVWETAGDSHQLDIELKNMLGKSDPEGAFLSQVPIDLGKLSKLLDSGDYTDVELSVDGQKQVVRAHRLILSAWSRPFAKMFTNGMRESKMDTVVIKDVGFEPLLVLINFMYKGNLNLEGDDVDDIGAILLPLLFVADQFGIHLLQKKCLDYLLESLTKDSACAVLHVAASMFLSQALCETCEELVAKHFDFCTALPALQFQELQASSLVKILQHPELRVLSEDKVVDAIFSWAAKKDGIGTWKEASTYYQVDESLFSDRLVDLEILLPNVRFPLISLTVLRELEASCLTRGIGVLRELVLEALEYVENGSDFVASQSNSLPEVDSKHGRLVRFYRSTVRFTPRPSTYKELQYICDGDCNGVFYHIGTLYGRHSWMNPVLAKRMFVSASSPPSRFTDVKGIVSRKYQGTSFAGPCLTMGQTSSWWKVDLGKDHQLMCNYYTVRQDGSTNSMRSWSLQGSNDDDNWREVSWHDNDPTLCRAGQYASWPVRGATASLPFRYFRVVLTKPTTSTVNPWNFHLCYLELYGFFH